MSTVMQQTKYCTNVMTSERKDK